MTNYRRYEILSTYDLPRIERELGEKYAHFGELFVAQNEAYQRLSPVEQARDNRETTRALDRIAAR